ncbi:Stk1 family PASTA domain-containing Ser/Thr kinase [Cellulomonas shaoxiangyii]|uniref:non-specific serine/threonine protein kinase n=1 Tax=Cellulomonas shaoxiangyii TaxID=2566013 RepID=A0A4P7SHB9_9CELL|nr:Stk1 family PASTA domain-containing Ser/Thr kinase [Cellulomonas shaoxiangyii]QCB93412.1 Stk1 family PASTA domain-containing Ser/Thr kinase [Cellulomonas shaoxiangyii]TGY84649.1 Stk1 family PASTA domain-containing Ser/Thr kinase [Cellulomonas shaoxiangyii]
MGATVTDPLVGRLVDGRYEVVSRLARGGMATVYLAVDRRLDREVALKVMHPHLAEGASGSAFVARFRREARTAARLTHPGLVGVYDQGVDGDTSYLTMEYVDGANLRRRISEEGALTVRESLRVLESVLDALAAAHRAGLVHRDVKPENVLLMSEDDRVRLGDFGLARAVTEVTSTTTGTVLGTVAYLAPELVTRGVSDARTDVYACGVLLYEMLTGRQPFTGETPIQVAFQHVSSEVPAPSTLVDWLPSEIDELVAALAARDADDRPVDATAACQLLRRTRASLDDATLDRRADVPPTVTLPAATGDADLDDEDLDHAATTRLSPADRRGGTVALPIGLGVSAPQPPPAGAERDRARRPRWVLPVAVATVLALVGLGTWWYLEHGPGAYTAVPAVVDLTEADAVSALEDAGLRHERAEAFDDDVPAGSVVATDPGPGDPVRKDGAVTYTVSRGVDLVDVPDGLVGQEQAAAEAALQAAELTAAYGDPEHSDDVARGLVLRATLPDGTPVTDAAQVKRGSAVDLVLSDGPAPVTVTSVVGISVQRATEQLAPDALAVTPTEAFSDTVPAGQIIEQLPKAGATAHRGDTVEVTVSKGPEPVQVPNVIQTGFDDAKATLEAAGFRVDRKNSWGGLIGRVVDQSVAGGETAPKGSTITLTVV